MSNKGSEFAGNIIIIWAVEDCIRASKKYTEGVKTLRKKHPVQGDDFLSKKFCKHYEVYPDINIEEIKPLWDAVKDTSDWLWGETPCIDVMFEYDYRHNKGSVVIKDGVEAVKELAKAIPHLSESLAEVVMCRNGNGIKVK